MVCEHIIRVCGEHRQEPQGTEGNELLPELKSNYIPPWLLQSFGEVMANWKYNTFIVLHCVQNGRLASHRFTLRHFHQDVLGSNQPTVTGDTFIKRQKGALAHAVPLATGKLGPFRLDHYWATPSLVTEWSWWNGTWIIHSLPLGMSQFGGATKSNKKERERRRMLPKGTQSKICELFCLVQAINMMDGCSNWTTFSPSNPIIAHRRVVSVDRLDEWCHSLVLPCMHRDHRDPIGQGSRALRW